MKYLVFGSTGNLGSALGRIIGHVTGAECVVSRAYDYQNDVGSQLAHHLREVAPDIVVNCAAMTGLDACEDSPAEALQINSVFPSHLAKCCSQLRLRLIQISTDNVFRCDESGEDHSELSDPFPGTLYGISKFLGERSVLNSDLSKIVRLPLLIGNPSFSSKLIVNSLVEKLNRGELVNVSTDVFNTPVYIDEVAGRIITISESFDAMPQRILHLAGSKRVSLFQVVSDLCRDSPFLRNLTPVESNVFPARVEKPKEGGLTSVHLPPLIYEDFLETFDKDFKERNSQ